MPAPQAPLRRKSEEIDRPAPGWWIEMSACEQPKPVTWQCDGPDCTSCAPTARCAARALDPADTLVGVIRMPLAERDGAARALPGHEETVAGLEAERQKVRGAEQAPQRARKRHTGGCRLREEKSRPEGGGGQAPREGGHGRQAVWGVGGRREGDGRPWRLPRLRRGAVQRNRRIHAALRARDRRHGEDAVHGQAEVLTASAKSSTRPGRRGWPPARATRQTTRYSWSGSTSRASHMGGPPS